jgi:ribosomal protein S18 acetylase RimI-like enzyme
MLGGVTVLIRPAPGGGLALPRGLSARAPRPGDLDALLALARADEAAAVGSSSMTRAEVSELLAPAHTTAQDDQRVVVDAAGALLAWGLVWDHNRTDHQDVDVYSSPALGSETVRGSLLDWLVARLGQRARAAGYERIVAGAGCYRDDVRYAATLRSRGFVYVRTFHRLRIDLAADQPVSVSTPPGVQVVPFEPSEDAWRALHAVLQRSFAEHWGHVPVAYDAFQASHAADPAPDLSLWRVALAEGRMVGVACASGRNAEDAGGWVADLGVLASHRGRGIARAMLQAAFEANRQAGRTWVALMVDTENDTGAVGLYESVGMHQEQSIDVYQRVVRPDAAT